MTSDSGKYPFTSLNAKQHLPEYPGETPKDDTMTSVRMYTTASSPTVSNDGFDSAGISQVFAPGDLWYDSSALNTYRCDDATQGAAVWTQMVDIALPADSVDADQLVDGWNDYVSELSQAKKGGGTVPTWAAIAGGNLYTWQFSASMMNELIIAPFHIEHDFKVGSTWHFHVHWLPDSTHTGTVRWGFEYAIQKGHQQGAMPVGSTTTIYIEQAGNGTQYAHMIAEDATGITDANVEVDSLIMGRLFRDGAHANDTYTGVAHGLTVDIHYQGDRLFTLNKAPNFYA